ncbi:MULTISPECIES: M56 family metallopeptidase [unclassified Mycobacterium]|uniref:M56 family metallopeptidase n=1 Tax=unclassified Mycobacterium TaxID=2642494 RepID=UPI00073FBFE8|nr:MULTISPECIES: M56 family metallopeptidase [unclassified Mycobacterium]KUH85476.1 peptidase M56 [Mycobacterium sp. GA-1999]KUH91335.1 peptidase M56 [Mycobacterium sp. GA-0227b]
MNAVTFLLIYAVALSWLAPAVLTSPIATSVHPRLSLTGWLVAVGTALFAWVAALAILVVGSAHSVITNTALTFCVETLGITSAVELPSSLATILVVALLALTAMVAIHTARRVIISLRNTRRCNREHADAVRIVGRPTAHNGVVVITADQPTAYCVSGSGRNAIVVTTAALELLDAAGLAAVLAHERAHLRGRHHHIIATLNALSAALTRLPLMRAAARSVPALLEMRADDAATRQYGRAPLMASLLTLSTRHSVPAGALAASGTAVVDRLLRLSQPARQPRWRPQALLMALVVGATPSCAALAFALCTP